MTLSERLSGRDDDISLRSERGIDAESVRCVIGFIEFFVCA